jgi:hypothetical protein
MKAKIQHLTISNALKRLFESKLNVGAKRGQQLLPFLINESRNGQKLVTYLTTELDQNPVVLGLSP